MWTEADSFAKRLLAVTLLLVLGASVAASLTPVLLTLLIDGLRPEGAHTPHLTPLYLVSAYATAHLLPRLLSELRGLCYGRTDQRVLRQLSSKLFQHVMSLPLRFHLDRRIGALNQTLTNGLLGYRVILHHLMLTVLPVIVELGTMTTVLVLLDHRHPKPTSMQTL